LLLLEEAKRRDHRKLGKELEFCLFSKVGQGLPLWLPKGAALRKIRTILEKAQKKAGYEQVITHTLVRKNYMLPLAIMPNMEQIAFNQSLPT
jgi:threonyl-tRNA synthetase